MFLGITDIHKYKNHGRSTYEWKIKNATSLQVMHEDMTGDGRPEYFLAIFDHEYAERCKKSVTCAQEKGFLKGQVVIGELDNKSYLLLPMDKKGQSVDWNHRTLRRRGSSGILPKGEVIFFEGKPYILTAFWWFKSSESQTNKEVALLDPSFFICKIRVYSPEKEKNISLKDVSRFLSSYTSTGKNIGCRFQFNTKK